MTTQTQTDFDVLIVGGGLVGGSLAIALANSSLRIGLVEAVPPDSDAQPSFDDRTIALSRGSHRILDGLGIWPRIADTVWPIRKIHVSEQRRFGTAVIDAREQRIAELGYVIKSRDLGRAIWEAITDCPGVETFCPARATGVRGMDGKRIVGLEVAGEEREVSASLLVVADGARSYLRGELGIQAAERDYGQVAIVANIQVDASRTGHIAYERFTREGPLAILPGRDGQYTLVLARNSDNAPGVMALSDEDLLGLVQAAFGFRLGRFRQLGKRHAYPLHLVTSADVTAERAAIIGNAANGLHPVAAQGFNLGLRDVASLAEILVDGRREDAGNFDAGSPEVLRAYASWRAQDQRNVVGFTDGLIRLFGIPGEAASVGRGLGLTAFDMLPAAKRELARQTMGLSGKLSRLARGLPL